MESSKIDINLIFSGDPSGGAAFIAELPPPPPTAEHGEVLRSTAISAEGEGDDHGLRENKVDVKSPAADISGEFLHDVDVDVDKGFLDCYFDADSVSPAENRINSVSILNLIDGTFRKTDFSDSDAPGFVRGAYIVEDGKKSNPNLQNSNLGYRIEASPDLKLDNSISPTETRSQINSISDTIHAIFKNSDTTKSDSDLGISMRNESIPVDDGVFLSISAIDSPGETNNSRDFHDNSPNSGNTSHHLHEIEVHDTHPSDDFCYNIHESTLKRNQGSKDNKDKKKKNKKNGILPKSNMDELMLPPMAKGSPTFVQFTSDEFQVSDIVWGKVQSHPWWPGQIFDPSSSSEMASTYYKGYGFLIAYFGDHTFAWNKPSQIKPFREWFTRFEPKSTIDAFRRAVGCAVDEVSRRAEAGMACPCLPKEVYDGVRAQVVVNAGVHEGSSLRVGGDRFSTPSAFDPSKLVRFLKSVSAAPLKRVADTLELVVFRAQLLAFYRHKNPRTGVEPWCNGSGRVHPGPVAFEVDPVQDSREGPRVGQRICNAISKLSESDPIFTVREEKHGRDRVVESRRGKRRRVSVDDGSVGGRLSQLRLAARDPLGGGGCTVTSSTTQFFTEFRDIHGRNLVSSPGPDTASRECGQDSYWTDRVVESIPEEFSSPEEERGEQKRMGLDLESVREEGGDATALILMFSDQGSVPSAAQLDEIFSRHGPLHGSETKVIKKSNRAKVVFKRRPDAEAAFSSTGKFGIFGPSLVSYRLRYLRKPISLKRAKKDGRETRR